MTARLAALLAVFGLAAGGALTASAHNTSLRLVRVVSGLQRPVFVTAAPGEPRRLYVVEQAGVIRVVERGKLRGAPFLDLRSLVGSDGNEQGLLGLAFDPGYATNHRLYVDYTDKQGDTNVVALRSSRGRVLPGSLRRLLFVDQPYDNHNGGMLAFGPDRLLYVGLGDGGSGGDPQNRAQDPGSRLGKLLRIDVRNGAVTMAGLGLRNPWRFSFDRATGDLYIGDVGQNTTEEVDYVRAGWTGPLNFGWRVYEGSSTFQDGALGPGALVAPIAEYSHQQGCSITGGYVYRGRAVRAALGRYYYGDFCSGRVWSLAVRAGAATGPSTEAFTVANLSSFGQDAAGELYLVSLDGTVYRLAS